MSALLLPALFAVFVWWVSTGLVLILDGLHPRTFRWTMLGATVLMGVSFVGLARSAADPSVTGAYTAFTCAMLAWAWHEISFYTGWVTGPRPEPAPEGSRGWQHFVHALMCSLWHELAILVSASLLVWLNWGAPNQIGTWTFLVLWWMHESARLNVFLGVPNLNEEFLPAHMRFLASFMTRKPMNLLFPLSVTLSTVVAVLLFQRALNAADAFGSAGFTVLGAMMAIAILEHWFLVVPLPTAKLWRWSLAARDRTPRFDRDQLKLAELELSTRLIERSRP